MRVGGGEGSSVGLVGLPVASGVGRGSCKGETGGPVGCTHSNMCTTKLYTYYCGRGKRVKRPCEHSISILPGTIRVNHYSSLAPLPLTHTSAKDYGWKSSMSSSRITRKRGQTPFLCRRESPRHEKKLSGDPFLLGAGYAAFAGWGPFRGPVPTGGYFEKRPPRAR